MNTVKSLMCILEELGSLTRVRWAPLPWERSQRVWEGVFLFDL